MVSLQACAKINWTLDILGKRADGYHRMDMLLQSVSLCDTLELWPADTLSLEGSSESASAKGIADDRLNAEAVSFGESNLVLRAARLLQQTCGCKAGARMVLRKRIPVGAGMGGGSADAAAALKGLNKLWGLGLRADELLRLGLTLGADVPFQLCGGLARVGGIGEELSPIEPAPEMHLIMVQPCAGLSTGQIFREYDALPHSAGRRPDTEAAEKALREKNAALLGASMGNVLENVCFPARPSLKKAAEALEANGAVRAMMTGSGSVIFGLFETESKAAGALPALTEKAAENGWGKPAHIHTLSRPAV